MSNPSPRLLLSPLVPSCLRFRPLLLLLAPPPSPLRSFLRFSGWLYEQKPRPVSTRRTITLTHIPPSAAAAIRMYTHLVSLEAQPHALAIGGRHPQPSDDRADTNPQRDAGQSAVSMLGRARDPPGVNWRRCGFGTGHSATPLSLSPRLFLFNSRFAEQENEGIIAWHRGTISLFAATDNSKEAFWRAPPHHTLAWKRKREKEKQSAVVRAPGLGWPPVRVVVVHASRLLWRLLGLVSSSRRQGEEPHRVGMMRGPGRRACKACSQRTVEPTLLFSIYTLYSALVDCVGTTAPYSYVHLTSLLVCTLYYGCRACTGPEDLSRSGHDVRAQERWSVGYSIRDWPTHALSHSPFRPSPHTPNHTGSLYCSRSASDTSY